MLPTHFLKRLQHCFSAIALGLLASPATAQVAIDPLAVTQLRDKPGEHWVWVNDIVFSHMADGKAFLLDGDSGSMLGMLSTGFAFNGVLVPKHGKVIYSPETYFSRGNRGTRTDVVTLYDGRTLAPTAEIAIPSKRVASIPMQANARLTDDDRFLLIYNFTPAQSVTVVDVVAKKFVGEIEIAGCALIYPTGPRTFFSLCSDGSALKVGLNDAGAQASKVRSPKLFDAKADPVSEKGVRIGSSWLFTTFAGAVIPLDASGANVQAGPAWSLLDAEAKQQSWRPGGIQHNAFHAKSGQLYSLMHVGGVDTHKDPGTEVWVYDVGTKKRVRRIKLKGPATSINVTQDEQALMFSMFIAVPKVDVYDARSGQYRRSIEEIGFTPATLVTY